MAINQASLCQRPKNPTSIVQPHLKKQGTGAIAKIQYQIDSTHTRIAEAQASSESSGTCLQRKQKFPKREQETQIQFLQRIHEDYTLPLRIATPPPDFSLLETPIHSKRISRGRNIIGSDHTGAERLIPTSNRYSRKLKLRENDDESSTNLGSVMKMPVLKGTVFQMNVANMVQKKTFFREDNNHLKLSSSTRRVKV